MEDIPYTIGEISKLFNVPASKIRYWEEREIFQPKRNSENDYRLFNLQATVELLDVIFYRNLNVPLKKMKHLNRLNPEAIYNILKDTETDVENELIALQQKLKGIASRKEQLETLFSLKEQTYQQEKIDIEKIVEVDMEDKEDIKIQLEFLSNFILYKEDMSAEEYKIGIAVPKNYSHHKEVYWSHEDKEDKIYYTCLLESNSEDLNDSNLADHEKGVKELGFKVNRVIASYLATASEDDKNSIDYYKAWLEVEEIMTESYQ